MLCEKNIPSKYKSPQAFILTHNSVCKQIYEITSSYRLTYFKRSLNIVHIRNLNLTLTLPSTYIRVCRSPQAFILTHNSVCKQIYEITSSYRLTYFKRNLNIVHIRNLNLTLTLPSTYIRVCRSPQAFILTHNSVCKQIYEITSSYRLTYLKRNLNIVHISNLNLTLTLPSTYIRVCRSPQAFLLTHNSVCKQIYEITSSYRLTYLKRNLNIVHISNLNLTLTLPSTYIRVCRSPQAFILTHNSVCKQIYEITSSYRLTYLKRNLNIVHISNLNLTLTLPSTYIWVCRSPQAFLLTHNSVCKQIYEITSSYRLTYLKRNLNIAHVRNINLNLTLTLPSTYIRVCRSPQAFLLTHNSVCKQIYEITSSYRLTYLKRNLNIVHISNLNLTLTLPSTYIRVCRSPQAFLLTHNSVCKQIYEITSSYRLKYLKRNLNIVHISNLNLTLTLPSTYIRVCRSPQAFLLTHNSVCKQIYEKTSSYRLTYLQNVIWTLQKKNIPVKCKSVGHHKQ